MGCLRATTLNDIHGEAPPTHNTLLEHCSRGVFFVCKLSLLFKAPTHLQHASSRITLRRFQKRLKHAS